jgi:hypothetical protein
MLERARNAAKGSPSGPEPELPDSLHDGLVDVVDVWGSRKKSRINATTVVKVEQKRWHDSDTVGGNLFSGGGPDFTPEVGDNLAEDQGVLGGDRSSVRLE